MLNTRFAAVQVHCDCTSRGAGVSFVAKHNCPSRIATFATAANTVSVAFKRVVPFLQHPVNIAFPFDRFARQFRFVRWKVTVTVLRNELFSESYSFRLRQAALLRIGDTSNQ